MCASLLISRSLARSRPIRPPKASSSDSHSTNPPYRQAARITKRPSSPYAGFGVVGTPRLTRRGRNEQSWQPPTLLRSSREANKHYASPCSSVPRTRGPGTRTSITAFGTVIDMGLHSPTAQGTNARPGIPTESQVHLYTNFNFTSSGINIVFSGPKRATP